MLHKLKNERKIHIILWKCKIIENTFFNVFVVFDADLWTHVSFERINVFSSVENQMKARSLFFPNVHVRLFLAKRLMFERWLFLSI